MKVGQWVRENNIIGIIYNHEFLDEYWEFNGINYHKECDSHLFTVANIPQELVQVGDLVEHDESENDNDLFKVKSVCKDGTVILRGSVPIFIEHITAIFTPNKDKTQYTEQWRKEVS